MSWSFAREANTAPPDTQESLTLLIFNTCLKGHQQNELLKPFCRLWGWSCGCVPVPGLLFLTTLQNSSSWAFSRAAGTSLVQGGVAKAAQKEDRGGCAAHYIS